MGSNLSSGMHPGAKVICINDHFPSEAFPRFACLPRLHEIYTIEAIRLGRHWRSRTPGIQLCLRECPPIRKDHFIGFHPFRFRLLTDHTALMAMKSHPRKPLAKPGNPARPFKPSPSPNHAPRLS